LANIPPILLAHIIVDLDRESTRRIEAVSPVTEIRNCTRMSAVMKPNRPPQSRFAPASWQL